LSEALDLIQPGGVTLIERKDGEPAACIKLLKAKHVINRVVVQSFDWKYLRDFHTQEPTQVLGALGPPSILSDGRKARAWTRKILNAAWLNELARTGAKVAVWNRNVSKQAIQLAHERGLKVWVYTINDARLADKLLHLGVDGLITNNPSLIWRTIALRLFRSGPLP
jgi:glycerophosphoryl diester phosphodiesterase